MTVRRFLRTPKGLTLIALAVLVVPAAIGAGVRLVLPELVAAVVTAMLIDIAILRVRKRTWVFPSGALLTGLIIGMILSPREPWWVAALTSAAGILSKYLFRARTANVFNPAALGLVVTFYPFATAQSWWGALPELAPAAIVVLFGAGIFIAQRVNKIPVVLSFLGCYYLMFTVTAFGADPGRVAELYRSPDLHAALFFAFFMVSDPPTSPPRTRDQIVYGAIVAITSYEVFMLVGAAYFLLAGLLVANGWEAWRRTHIRSRRTVAAPVRASGA